MTDPVPSKELKVFELMRKAGFAEEVWWIRRLETALRGISTCSTCEACRGAATLALGGAERQTLDDQTLLTIANQFDQGPGATFEFDQPTLLNFMRSFAATVEGMVSDGAMVIVEIERLRSENEELRARLTENMADRCGFISGNREMGWQQPYTAPPLETTVFIVGPAEEGKPTLERVGERAYIARGPEGSRQMYAWIGPIVVVPTIETIRAAQPPGDGG